LSFTKNEAEWQNLRIKILLKKYYPAYH
jgi:hypothetical protein